VVIEAIRGEKTLSQLGSQFKVHPIQIVQALAVSFRHALKEKNPATFSYNRVGKLLSR
jgi:hypothetical protein